MKRDLHSSITDGSSLISDGQELICNVLLSAFKKTPALINEDPPSPVTEIRTCWRWNILLISYIPCAENTCCPSPRDSWRSRVGSFRESSLEIQLSLLEFPDTFRSLRHCENVCGNDPAGFIVSVTVVEFQDSSYIFSPSQVLTQRRSSLPAPFD